MGSTQTVEPTTAARRFCARCGYNLQGLDNDRCPECGQAFDPNRKPAELPWLHRHERGVWRAYLQTLALVILNPRRMAEAIAQDREISAAEASRFREMTIAVAFVPLWAAWVMAVWTLDPLHRFHFVHYIAITIAGAVACQVYLRLSSAVRWASPGRSPLIDYACAPLALMPISSAFGCINALFDRWDWPIADRVTLGIFLTYAGFQAVVWLVAAMVISQGGATPTLARRCLALAVVAWWVVLSVFFLAVLPAWIGLGWRQMLDLLFFR